jgi:hypothetical protein
VVAESVRDDGRGEFEELLPDGGAAGGGDRDSDLVQERGQVIGVERLAGPAAGKEPAGQLGIQGAVRGKRVITTIPGGQAGRAPDAVR